MDPIYGPLLFPADIASLIQAPLVQRMRHVRLSNIDSMDMPGIANTSRYEHVLGTAYLATELGFYRQLSRIEQTALVASALLHDWAITSFGHLVEEALQYAGTGFDHERRLLEILTAESPDEIGGVDRQVLVGRPTHLMRWVRQVAGPEDQVNELLTQLTENIRGKGLFGSVIAGAMDLDNIDSVFRLSYHMGLATDRDAPRRLARAFIEFDRNTCIPLLSMRARDDVEGWLLARRILYENLMLAPRDFAGKLMIIYSAVRALEEGELTKGDWALVDAQLICRMLTSDTRDVRDTIERWMAGELWDLTPLQWMEGSRPDYRAVRTFSKFVSDNLRRPCFAYAIKDKRLRRVHITYVDGETQEFGAQPSSWLLGVGSPVRRPFTAAEVHHIFRIASSHFSSQPLPSDCAAVSTGEPWLF